MLYSSRLTERPTAKTADSIFVILTLNTCMTQTQKPNLNKEIMKSIFIVPNTYLKYLLSITLQRKNTVLKKKKPKILTY